MIEKKPIDFYYFSGTGNTYLVVKAMKDAFEKHELEVNLLPLVRFTESGFNENNIVGLAFPVAAQGTYPLCWEFLNKLPQVNGTQIFMVDTLAGISGGIVGPVKKILRKKGFTTIGAKEIRMPSNYFTKGKNKEKIIKMIKTGKGEAKKFADDIVNGTSGWARIPVFSDLLSLLSKSNMVWQFMRKMTNIKLDTNLCTLCDLCEKACPINNIVLKPYPTINNRCQLCQKCIAVCPTEALICAFKNKDGKAYTPYRAKGVAPDELID
ncbi:MAG: EFR1 family ferrodoxin [Clostridiales bacterium]|nr:EFR1 family ferrodoxin [Clostridiales bacterium]